jgi:hypothetical protein
MTETPSTEHSREPLHAGCYYCGATPGSPHRTGCAIADCRRRGWFAVRAPEGQPSYVPCTQDTPDATEDLNRWAVFRATGEDRGYSDRASQPPL